MGRFSRIAVLLIVWMTVLLVPSLRTAFRAQLQGSPLQRFAVLPTFSGLNGYWEAHALKRPNDRDYEIFPKVVYES